MPLRLPRVVRRLLAFRHWQRRDREMDQEMAFHIQSIKDDLMRSGMNEAEAERAARRRFGSVLQLKEAGHDVRSGHVVENVVRDARHMARGLRKSPVFTITVVLTLALGIGGNTAIFSVVDQLLLRPLPYPHGEQLVTLGETFAFEVNTVLAGNTLGIAAAVVLLRWLGTLLFGVTPNDVSTYATVLALLAAVAALASYVPARRASRVEPLVALRQD